jgi:glycosyltransferase involved in cell wall biosynthesis
MDAIFIPYGADPFEKGTEETISAHDLEKYQYYLAIARMEPENNLETIIEGYLQSGVQDPLIIVGNANNKYGEILFEKYRSVSVRFIGAVYDQELLNNLRFFSKLYFHGHSVGGTNPSLLEAMAAQAMVCAHSNPFNEAVLGDDALYFSGPEEIAEHLKIEAEPNVRAKIISANLKKIREQYTHLLVANSYEELIKTNLK